MEFDRQPDPHYLSQLLTDDLKARKQAININASYIVQAPAGSGKTEVLTQRFLALLAVAQSPEEVLGITFTNKATAEMRQRVIAALQSAAASDECPTSEPDASRWQLAQAVLARDAQQQWHLLASPHRLRVMTIDGLCHWLLGRSPMASTKATASIHPHPSELYEKVVYRLLQGQETDAWTQALSRLLTHFNADYGYFHKVLQQLLRNRSSWAHDAQVITQGLYDQRFSQSAVGHLFQQHLDDIQAHITTQLNHLVKPQLNQRCELFNNLLMSLGFAASNCGVDLFDEPDAQLLDWRQWQFAGDVLLTKDGGLRKSFTKKQGFPAPSSLKGEAQQQAQAHKTQITAIVQQLNELAGFTTWLQLLQQAPASYTTDEHWPLAFDLFAVGVAGLELLEAEFTQGSQVDFTAMAEAASALFQSDDPSELMLRLDYQLQHILLDEFQDTSLAQIELLTQLTQGWQAGDGRTLFLVGDPMQSIYRFRQAEVSLFYQVQRQGIGEIQCEFLQLRQNFRSLPELVLANNQAMQDIFPAKEDSLLSQVEFSQAIAGQKPPSISTPQQQALQTTIFASVAEEIQWIIQQIRLIQNKDLDAANPSQPSMALLVRKRNLVVPICEAFRAQGIVYNAIELDRLNAFWEVRDLAHIANLLFGPFDPVDLIAFCRAPWIGLDAVALIALAQRLESTEIHWLDAACYSFAAGHPLPFALHQLQKYRQQAALTPLERLQSLWFALLGPELITSERAMALQTVWQLLTNASHDGQVNLDQFHQSLDNAYASSLHSQAAIEIMTIHRSKGLEFDYVFLPQLNATEDNQASDLVSLLPFQLPTTQMSQMLVGVRAGARNNQSQLVSFLEKIRKQQGSNESIRLLYVAMTRARKGLLLSAVLKQLAEIQGNTQDDLLLPDGIKPPNKSFLKLLWHAWGGDRWQWQCSADSIATLQLDNSFGPLQRIPLTTWQRYLPATCVSPAISSKDSCAGVTSAALATSQATAELHSQLAEYWLAHTKEQRQQILAARVGETIHAWFAHHNAHTAFNNTQGWIEQFCLQQQWRFSRVDLQRFHAELKSIFHTMEQDPQVFWLLQARKTQYKEVVFNYRVSATHVKTLRPDLAFIEADLFWIIDFKTEILPEQLLNNSAEHMADLQDYLWGLHGQQLVDYGGLFKAQANNLSGLQYAIYLSRYAKLVSFNS